MKKEVPIFFAVNNDYIPFLSVALLSIKERVDKNNLYKIKVLNANTVSESYKERLLKENACDFFDIEFVDVSPFVNSLNGSLHTRDYYSKETYYRIFIADMYPQYDKALYLDSDIILLNDLSKLYDTPLDKELVGAIPDQSVMYFSDDFKAYVENRIGVKYYEYFNAGILVLNLKQMREIHLREKFINLLKEVKFDVAQDQDYLNVICKDKVKYIGQEWNTMPLPVELNEKGLPSLIHFNLSFKPWILDDVKYGEYFWNTAKRSVFYDDILKIKDTYNPEMQKNIENTTKSLIALTRVQSLDSAENERIKRVVEKIVG